MVSNNSKLIPSTVPVPDPTKLTTDAVAFLKEELLSTIDLKLIGLKELFLEKFKGVSTEFAMRDIALAAAFKAAEAAVKQQNESNTLAIDKASVATTKQIDALYEKINDIKERVATVSNRNWSAMGAYIVGAIGIIALIMTIMNRSMLNHI
jgi:polyhydroxyalkanoate synthesis regulator phasin